MQGGLCSMQGRLAQCRAFCSMKGRAVCSMQGRLLNAGPSAQCRAVCSRQGRLLNAGPSAQAALDLGQFDLGQKKSYGLCNSGGGGVGALTWKRWGPEGWGPEGWGPEGLGPEGWP